MKNRIKINGRMRIYYLWPALLTVLLVFATVVAGTLAGLDVFTSVTAALSMVGNIGPAFGSLNPTSNYGFLPPLLKWWYCFAMLAGRLEIYTLLLLATGFRRNTPSRNT